MLRQAHRAQMAGHREAVEAERRRYRDLREKLKDQADLAHEHRQVLADVRQGLEADRLFYRKALAENQWVLALADFFLLAGARLRRRPAAARRAARQEPSAQNRPAAAGGTGS